MSFVSWRRGAGWTFELDVWMGSGCMYIKPILLFVSETPASSDGSQNCHSQLKRANAAKCLGLHSLLSGAGMYVQQMNQFT